MTNKRKRCHKDAKTPLLIHPAKHTARFECHLDMRTSRRIRLFGEFIAVSGTSNAHHRSAATGRLGSRRNQERTNCDGGSSGEESCDGVNH